MKSQKEQSLSRFGNGRLFRAEAFKAFRTYGNRNGGVFGNKAAKKIKEELEYSKNCVALQ